MKRILRRASIVVGVAVAALALAACGTGTTTGGSVDSIKVVIAGYSPDHTPEFWNAFADTYKKTSRAAPTTASSTECPTCRQRGPCST
ncbi:MAG: hypothetical protein ABI632_12535, partial [Pseudolysinimonas sp.]